MCKYIILPGSFSSHFIFFLHSAKNTAGTCCLAYLYHQHPFPVTIRAEKPALPMTFYRTVRVLSFAACILFNTIASAQRKQPSVKITLLNTGTTASFRGLSVVNARVIWASGTNGTVGKTLDGGKSWQWNHTSACDSCDWRSIAALSDKEAFIINAGSPARLLHTKDGGLTWEQQYYNAAPAAFFDCLRFSDAAHGFAIGDPLNDHFPLLYSYDSGHVWNEYNYANDNYPPALPGEAIFAASNSNISPDHDMPRFITGGLQSRIFSAVKAYKSDTSKNSYIKWSATPLPILHGKASTGAFAVDFFDAKHGVVAGGDYANDTLRTQNFAYTTNGGLSWESATTAPFGYRSGITFISTKWLAATGTSGTDYSDDGGKNWHNISKEGFNTIQKIPGSLRALMAGAHGKIGILEIGAPEKIQ